jgi:hypothetical protein
MCVIPTNGNNIPLSAVASQRIFAAHLTLKPTVSVRVEEKSRRNDHWALMERSDFDN